MRKCGHGNRDPFTCELCVQARILSDDTWDQLYPILDQLKSVQIDSNIFGGMVCFPESRMPIYQFLTAMARNPKISLERWSEEYDFDLEKCTAFLEDLAALFDNYLPKGATLDPLELAIKTIRDDREMIEALTEKIEDRKRELEEIDRNKEALEELKRINVGDCFKKKINVTDQYSRVLRTEISRWGNLLVDSEDVSKREEDGRFVYSLTMTKSSPVRWDIDQDRVSEEEFLKVKQEAIEFYRTSK